MELIQLGENTYYIKNATNIGLYKVEENKVYLIDTGNDTDAGKKILKIVEEQGWQVVGIINTHSNADHIGGNKIIQSRTGSPIYANAMERCFTEYPLLEPSFLYGGYPFKELRGKFLMAKESKVQKLENLPDGLEYFSLKGHFFDMIGIKTSDNVYFLGDALFSEETITKYHVFFIYDIREYVNTLDFLQTLNGEYYIASHIECQKNIKNLIDLNRQKIEEIGNKICEIVKTAKTFENILKEIFNQYNMMMNANQYVLVGSTIKSYLSYLYEEGRVVYLFENNEMVWKIKE